MTNQGEPFLLFDSDWEGRDPSERVLMFSTLQNLQNLSFSFNWGSDGTYEICPAIFKQFYTIHCDGGCMSIPMVYVLVARQNAETYRYVIQKLIERIRKYVDPEYAGPRTWTTDFEPAMIKAVREELGCISYGCYFHFCQAVWRHIQKYRLSDLYNRSTIYHSKLRILIALAFLPPDEVQDAFQDLIDDNFFFDSLEELTEVEIDNLREVTNYENFECI